MGDMAKIAAGLLKVLCRDFEDHTPSPEGYIQWHVWAATMAKTHKQRRCKSCGKFAIWEPRDHIAKQMETK